MTQKKRQSAGKACDEMISKIVRSRGACEECGQTWDLQCAHGFSRSYRRVRYDERNLFCLCRGCHVKYTHRPLEWDDWLRSRWGDDLYAEMRRLAREGPVPDLPKLRAALNERVKDAA